MPTFRQIIEKTRMKPDNYHDKFFKTFMSIRKAALALVKNRLPAQTASLDLRTFRLSKDSFVDEKLAESFSDIVYRCRLKMGREARITYLFEHKSSPYKYILIQLLRYFTNQWELDLQENKEPSVIVAIVVYHGKEDWDIKPFAALFEGIPKEFLPYLPDFTVEFVNLHKMPDEEIETIDGSYLASAFLTMKHFWDKNYILQNFKKLFIFVRQEWQNPVGVKFVTQMMVYITRNQNIKKKEIMEMTKQLPQVLETAARCAYEEFVLEGEKKGIKKGMVLGVKQGLQKGLAKGAELNAMKSVQNLFLKFPALKDAEIAEIVEMPLSFVRKIRAEIKKRDLPYVARFN